jgi:hypothetical protein
LLSLVVAMGCFGSPRFCCATLHARSISNNGLDRSQKVVSRFSNNRSCKRFIAQSASDTDSATERTHDGPGLFNGTLAAERDPQPSP